MNLRYGLLQGAYWAAMCTVIAFFVQLFKGYGYDTMECCIISACGTAALIISQPLWGALCDRAKKVKPVLLTAIGLGMASVFLFYLGGRSIYWMIAGVVAFSVTFRALMYIYDIWAVRLRNDGASINFGITRSVGSGCYALVAAFFGLAIDKWGTGIIVPCFLGGAVLVAVMTLTIREPQVTVKNEDRVGFIEGVRGLVKNREYLLLLLCIFLVFSASNGFILFLPYRIYELGGTDAHYGYATFIMALSEIPALLLYKTLAKRLSPRVILCIAFFFVAVKIFSTAIFDSVPAVIASQAFQAPAYGLYLCAISNYIAQVVPRSFVFTAQTVLSAVAAGLAPFCAYLLMGGLSETYSATSVITVVGFSPLAGFAIMALFIFFTRKKKA
ncbi:MAG: MFS transporter [Clostridia bacterium]|nr:MFS transporter [Clostridia bacterium]